MMVVLRNLLKCPKPVLIHYFCNMHRLILILLGLLGYLLTTSCYDSDRECTRFKTGTFEWSQEIEGEEVTARFVRTNDYQIEYFQDRVDSSTIKWINDCEYRITPINPKTNAESRAYLFKIIRTEGDRFYFRFQQSGDEALYDGMAVKTAS